VKEEQLAGDTTRQHCLDTPHSLSATTATVLLDASEDICKEQELLSHITTTQIYDSPLSRGKSWAVPAASGTYNARIRILRCWNPPAQSAVEGRPLLPLLQIILDTKAAKQADPWLSFPAGKSRISAGRT
jgi:hypothetical protein